VNLSDKIDYQIEKQRYRAGTFHFNGMRNKPGFIMQAGKIRVFGISFYPFGLYPFLNVPMLEFGDQVNDLELVDKRFVHKLEAAIENTKETSQAVNAIEKALLLLLDQNTVEMKKIDMVRRFCSENKEQSVSCFCKKNGLNIKTLERNCLKYAGYTPKTLVRIGRFQSASKQLIYNEGNSFVELACNSGYYDQAHFIKDFQEFSGTTPGQFSKAGLTVKENSRYSFL
jgi:AraC-like DNA-binding protein